MSGRRLFLMLVLAGATLVSLLMASLGPDRTWSLWNIPPMHPCFADARNITAGAESHRDGFDPMVDNPADPWHRPMDYPRVWQLLFQLGLSQRSTVALAVVMIVAFLGGIALFARGIDRLTACALALALFSPAVLLGIERANITLLIFFLCAGALVMLRRSATAAALLLTAAGVLMYYPFLGLACLAREGRRACLWLAGLSAVAGIAYMALTWRDVILVLHDIERGTFMSYGLNVGWMTVRQLTHSNADTRAAVVVSVLLLAGAVMALVRSSRLKLRPAAAPDQQHLDGFRLGAAIYVGTFLMGNNWDYRLVFTLFCLPQLVDWSRDARHELRLAARLALVALLTSLWSQFLFPLAHHVPGGGIVALVVDEAADWLLLGALLYLLPAALPDWLRGRGLAPAQVQMPVV